MSLAGTTIKRDPRDGAVVLIAGAASCGRASAVVAALGGVSGSAAASFLGADSASPVASSLGCGTGGEGVGMGGNLSQPGRTTSARGRAPPCRQSAHGWLGQTPFAPFDDPIARFAAYGLAHAVRRGRQPHAERFPSTGLWWAYPDGTTPTTTWRSVRAGEAHMSGTTPDPAPGANPFGELAKFALAATERNMALARSWSDALLTTLKEQSEDARATLTTLAASLEAMERALASQEETTAPCGRAWRAIGRSLTAMGPRRNAPPGWCRPPSTTSRRPARARWRRRGRCCRHRRGRRGRRPPSRSRR